MSTQSVSTEGIKERLIKHLVEVEEQGENLIEEFFPSPSPEREEIKETLKEYINKLEEIVKVWSSIKNDKDFPMVIIGSRVKVKDVVSNENLVFQIISPFGEMPCENGISPLSPVGRALLLQKVGAEVSVDAPAGTFFYEILAINYPAC